MQISNIQEFIGRPKLQWYEFIGLQFRFLPERNSHHPTSILSDCYQTRGFSILWILCPFIWPIYDSIRVATQIWKKKNSLSFPCMYMHQENEQIKRKHYIYIIFFLWELNKLPFLWCKKLRILNFLYCLVS